MLFVLTIPRSQDGDPKTADSVLIVVQAGPRSLDSNPKTAGKALIS